MVVKKGAVMMVDDGQGTVRTTVTVTKPDYEEMERIAKAKRVSVAWVVREAVSEYLASSASSGQPGDGAEKRPQ